MVRNRQDVYRLTLLLLPGSVLWSITRFLVVTASYWHLVCGKVRIVFAKTETVLVR